MVRSAGAPDSREDETERAIRPQTLLFALLGDQVLDRGVAVATGSVIGVLEQLGVGEHATRATLARMTRRGLLRRLRRGRQTFLGLTPRAVAVLRDGRHKLRADVVEREWDGCWTLLAFTVPESRRAARHALRTRLAWAGFAPLRSGLWISPRAADVSEALADLDLLDQAEVFRAEAAGWTDPAQLVRQAWDLGGLAADYRRFLARWPDGGQAGPDALTLRTRLTAEWLLLIRQEPRLPQALLPADWPGVRAQERFRNLQSRLTGPAGELAAARLVTVPDGVPHAAE
ncbi:PaaX family transcriptional regulator C-terminal domain-containing protein [Streptomyces sp. 7-21]|uniref:PaaX family transcriptional regulator n=1 Tax=Streptomyces sp. 7-21 TaxID=2802283 RepID=UPI0027DC2CFF|nr:PaaX family transcriptional regulator C-terminal domain-containing protein [Streptomyces sp. 7-21]